MNLAAFLLVLGLVVAVLVHWSLGLLMMLAGLVLMFAPVMR